MENDKVPWNIIMMNFATYDHIDIQDIYYVSLASKSSRAALIEAGRYPLKQCLQKKIHEKFKKDMIVRHVPISVSMCALSRVSFSDAIRKLTKVHEVMACAMLCAIILVEVTVQNVIHDHYCDCVLDSLLFLLQKVKTDKNIACLLEYDQCIGQKYEASLEIIKTMINRP